MSLDQIQDFLTSVFNQESLAGMVADSVIPILTGVGGYLWGKRRQKKKMEDVGKNIEKNELDSEDVLVSVTYFHPTGETNPDTGKEIYELRIINSEDLSLSDLFKDGAKEWYVKYSKEAKEKCTDENPCLLMHLRDVIPDSIKDKDKIVEDFSHSILNAVSARLNDSHNVVTTVTSLNETGVPETMGVLPVLTFEPSSLNKQMRLLIVQESMLTPGTGLPQIENVRFKTYDDEGNITYDADDALNQARRLRTMQTIADLYHGNRGLFNATMVDVITGREVVRVPEAANDGGTGAIEIMRDALPTPDVEFDNAAPG